MQKTPCYFGSSQSPVLQIRNHAHPSPPQSSSVLLVPQHNTARCSTGRLVFSSLSSPSTASSSSWLYPSPSPPPIIISNQKQQPPILRKNAHDAYTHEPGRGRSRTRQPLLKERHELRRFRCARFCGVGLDRFGEDEICLRWCGGSEPEREEMTASARQGDRASSFAVACSLLSRYVRQNGAAAAERGLGINKGEAEPQRATAAMSLLPGAEGEEAGRKETMELFPQSAGLGGAQDAAVSDAAAREQEKRQLTIFYGGKVLVFNDFPADKAKGLMQLAGKGSPVVQNVSAPTPVTDSTKVEMVVPAPASSLPGAQVDAQKPARQNASDLPIARKASLHRFLEKRKDRLHAKAPYQASPSDATPVKKEPESQPWLGLGPNAAMKPNLSISTECSK